MKRTIALVVVALAVQWLSDTVSRADSLSLFRIGTGGRTGVYYPIGKLIAQGLTADAIATDLPGEGGQGLAGMIGVAQNSAGSIDNIRMVASGTIEAGLVQADVADWAYTGQGVFADDKRVSVVRAVASLYPEKLQIVTRGDAGVTRFAGLRGKRISIDEVGSGTLAVIRIALEAHGLRETDLQPVYLKPVFTHEKIVSGELQGFGLVAGVPAEAVTRLADIGIHAVPIAPEVGQRIHQRHSFLVPGMIPAGVYAGIPETPTLEVYALLVVNATMDEALVYQVTTALWSSRTQELLHQGHPQGRAIRLDTALKGLSIPLHPGALRYYRERGLTIPGVAAQ